VLDNPGPADDEAWAKEAFPEVEWIRCPTNDFLFSYNWLLPQLQEEVVILLNNDLRVAPDFFEPLVKPLADLGVFAVSAKSLSWDGCHVTSAAYQSRTHYGWSFWKSFDSDETVETFFAVGGFMAVDRKKFIALGGFDRLFFPAYGEDVDLCLRAKKRGWKSLYVPDSIVWHKEGASWNYGDNPRRAFLSYKSHFLIQWRYFNHPLNSMKRNFFCCVEIIARRKPICLAMAWWQANKAWRAYSGLAYRANVRAKTEDEPRIMK
jgi:GT2 family glycosyltransferase